MRGKGRGRGKRKFAPNRKRRGGKEVREGKGVEAYVIDWGVEGEYLFSYKNNLKDLISM